MSYVHAAEVFHPYNSVKGLIFGHMRRIAPIVLLNVVVIAIVASVIVNYPKYTTIATLVMPVLFLNFMFFLRLHRKTAEEIASGKAAAPSVGKKKKAMWGLALYGAASYVSGAFNVPELLQRHESGMWLGWESRWEWGPVASGAHTRSRKASNTKRLIQCN